MHQRHRLGILVILSETRRADFSYLKTTLGLTDGNLGRHLEVLGDAGFVEVERVFEGRKPRSWASITPAGRTALAAELDVLQQIVDRARTVDRARPASTRGEGRPGHGGFAPGVA